MPKNPGTPMWCTRDQASERLMVSLPYIDALITTGALPAYRLGPRSVRIKTADLDALLLPVPVESAVAP